MMTDAEFFITLVRDLMSIFMMGTLFAMLAMFLLAVRAFREKTIRDGVEAVITGTIAIYPLCLLLGTAALLWMRL